MATKWEYAYWEDEKCGSKMMPLRQNERNAGGGYMAEDDECLATSDASNTATADAMDAGTG